MLQTLLALCALLWRVYQQEPLRSYFLSLSLSLFLPLSLFLACILSPLSSPLSRLHPCGVPPPTSPPSFHLVLHLSSAPDWESVSYNRCGKFSSGDFDGRCLFSRCNPSPSFSPCASILVVDRFPHYANIRGHGLEMKSFGGFLFESVCVCVCSRARAHARTCARQSLKNEGDDNGNYGRISVLATRGIKSIATKKSLFTNGNVNAVDEYITVCIECNKYVNVFRMCFISVSRLPFFPLDRLLFSKLLLSCSVFSKKEVVIKI